MFPNPESLKIVTAFLAEYQIPYMIIGGLANSVWGEVRATRDADFKVAIGDQPVSEFRKLILTRFSERITSLPLNIQSAHVIHIWATEGVAVDLLVSVFDYEREAVERAIAIIFDGVPVRVCTAEDLIVHKAIANRDKDWIDIERVLVRQKSKLNQAYIVRWLEQFSEALETPEILTRYQQLRARYDS